MLPNPLVSPSSNLHCHQQNSPYHITIVEPTINLFAPPKTFGKPPNQTQHSHAKWKPKEVTIGIKYVLAGNSWYSNAYCNCYLQNEFTVLENESFNVFYMRCRDHDIMTYAVGLYLTLSFWLCLKDTISMYLVSTRLVLLWQHVHVPIIGLAWDCIWLFFQEIK